VEDSNSVILDEIYLPEQDAFSLNFQNAGFGSTYFLANVGELLWMSMFHISLVIVLISFLGMTKCKPNAKKPKKCRSKLSRYLFWNGSIRLLMESYTEFALFVLLDLKYMEWPTDQPGVTLNNYVTILFSAIVLLGPLVLIVYGCKNMNRLADKKMQRRLGTFTEGTAIEKKDYAFVAVLVPTSYFVRRLLLVATLVFW